VRWVARTIMKRNKITYKKDGEITYSSGWGAEIASGRGKR